MWWLAMSGVVWAATCVEPTEGASSPTMGPVLTGDGSAQVLTTDGTITCWWTVDDNGDATVSGRWEATPVGIAPLEDAGVVVVLQRSSGITAVVAREPWTATRMGPKLPLAPSRVYTRDGIASFALLFPERDGYSRLWVVDLSTGRLEANLLVGDGLDLGRWPELAVAVE